MYLFVAVIHNHLFGFLKNTKSSILILRINS